MDTPKTLQDAIVWFADWENCRRFLEMLRWSDGKVRCPNCDSERVVYLANARVYKCYGKHEKAKFSLKTGTIFEDSPIGLEKWLPALWLVVNSKNGVSSCELARSLGVSQKSAWFMAHRIRFALKSGSFSANLGSGGGPVEVDECFVGGEPKNWHLSKRATRARFTPKDEKKVIQKTAVVGLLDRSTREVRAKVIPNVSRETLQDAILANIQGGSTVYTDAAKQYSNLPTLEFIHGVVNHMEEYVRGEVHTNGIENFWALLKRGLKGTYVSVEPFHLERYVDEQIFKYNYRATKDVPRNDRDRFVLAAYQIVGKRLTWNTLTGKEQ